jgi:STIMATE family
MGIFPIIMNVLQFWLIDSIVKASVAVALPVDSRRSSLDDPERETLFVASDDEDDSGVRPRYDIENPRPLSRSSQTHDNRETRSSTSASSGQSTLVHAKEARDSVSMHAYPPSVASTSTIRSSTPQDDTSPKPTRRPFKRRSPPPPLRLNSPPVATVPIALPVQQPQDQSNKKWTESWDESDDWANRVGEEEWTGRRMEQTRDALNATVVHAVA